jgi:hypothetical protein
VTQNGGFAVSASQLSQVHYHAGSSGSSDHIYANVSDGIVWATPTQFDVTVPQSTNHAPVITSLNVTATAGQVFQASALVSASDSDGDPLVSYAFWDSTSSGGYFDLNGVTQNGGFAVSASQLSQVHYHAGSSGSSDHIYANVFDGTVWATATQFDVTVPQSTNHAPVITSSNVTATAGQVFQASALVSASDPDNDPLVSSTFWDSTPGGGYFDVNGASQNSGFVVSASQLSQVHYHAGSSGSSDHIYANVFDGTVWGSPTQFNVIVPASNTLASSSTVADNSAAEPPIINPVSSQHPDWAIVG